MADVTKEELKKELAKLKERIDIFENVQKELEKEDPKIAELLRAVRRSNTISTIIAARLIGIVSSFFKVDPGTISINKS